MGCDDCHTIAVSGAKGRLGPNLDAYLAGLPASAIREYILHPLTVMIPGYTHDLMPNNFDTRLSHDDLVALIDYLQAASGTGGGASSSSASSSSAASSSSSSSSTNTTGGTAAPASSGGSGSPY